MLSSNRNRAARSPRPAAATAYWLASVDLPVPAGPRISVLVPRARPPPSRSSSEPRPLLTSLPGVGGLVLGGDEPGEHVQPAPADDVIVIAGPEVAAPQLDHLQPPPHGSIVRRMVLQADHPVGQAVQADVPGLAGLVVEEQDGALLPAEVLLEGQDLPAVAERVLRQQPQLGKRVEDQPGRPGPFGFGEHGLHRLAELDLRGVEHGVPGVRPEALLGGDHLDDLDAV